MNNAYAIKANNLFLFDKQKEDEAILLERYFNDIYPLFLKTLTEYAMANKTDDATEQKLTKLLSELIAVKKSLLN